MAVSVPTSKLFPLQQLILYLPLLLRCRLLNLLNSSQDVLHLLYVSTFPFHALKSLHEQFDGDDDNVSDTTPISSHRLCGKRCYLAR